MDDDDDASLGAFAIPAPAAHIPSASLATTPPDFEAFQPTSADILRAVTSLNVRYDRSDAVLATLNGVDEALGRQATDIAGVAARVDSLDALHADLARRLELVEARSAMPSSASSASSRASRLSPATLDPYATDRTIVRINADQVVAATAVRHAFRKYFDDAKVPQRPGHTRRPHDAGAPRPPLRPSLRRPEASASAHAKAFLAALRTTAALPGGLAVGRRDTALRSSRRLLGRCRQAQRHQSGRARPSRRKRTILDHHPA